MCVWYFYTFGERTYVKHDNMHSAAHTFSAISKRDVEEYSRSIYARRIYLSLRGGLLAGMLCEHMLLCFVRDALT